MNNMRIISSQVFEKLKQNAKKLKKKHGIPHHEALEKIAKDFGFNNWHSVCLAYEPYKLNTDIYKNGSILAIESKEAIDFIGMNDDLISEDTAIISSLIGDDYYQIFINSINPDDPEGRTIKESETQNEIEAWFRDVIDDAIFFRINKKNISMKETLEISKEYFFFPPLFIYVKGQYFDSYNLPASDKDGNIVGVRF